MKALAHPIGEARAYVNIASGGPGPPHNLLECVEFPSVLAAGFTITNEYTYVRNTSGGQVAANVGVRWTGDIIGGVIESGFQAGAISAQFIGITTVVSEDDEYIWLLTKGGIEIAAVTAAALNFLTCSSAGALSATAIAASADGDVGFVTIDDVSVIGYGNGINTLT